MSAARLSPASFLKLSADVASFYGFRPLREVEREAALIQQKGPPFRATSRPGSHSFITATTVCAHCLTARPQEPVLAFYATPSPSHILPGLPARETGEFGLSVVGSSESVSEAVIIKTIAAITTEWSGGVARVRVNALGDRDSQQRFARELSVYLRRYADTLDPACREAAQRDPLAAYRCTTPACREILAEGPRTVNFLSEKSRAHFRELLEHLERLGLPYTLDDLLVGDEREQRIVFAVDVPEPNATMLGTFGGRYDEFVRRVTGRKEGSAVSASIFFKKRGVTRKHFVAAPPQRAPRIFFVQLGLKAKLQGLEVLDMLRAARMGVSQSFDSTHLASQLEAARRAGVSHLIIMGQREALDGTVIVRSAENSVQITMALTQLPRYLKTLRV